MNVYLDNGVLNRPLDDEAQARVALDTEGVVPILGMAETGEIRLIVPRPAPRDQPKP